MSKWEDFPAAGMVELHLPDAKNQNHIKFESYVLIDGHMLQVKNINLALGIQNEGELTITLGAKQFRVIEDKEETEDGNANDE